MSRRNRAGRVVGPAFAQNHRYLTFSLGYNEETREQFRERLADHINQPVEVFEAVNWTAMESIRERQGFSHGHEIIKNILVCPYYLEGGAVGFVSEAWYRMFAIREVLYRELIIEFYSTFRFQHTIRDWDMLSISFQLGGVPREMSLVEFAVAVGLYTEDETHNIYFRPHLTEGAIMPLSSIEVSQAWYALTNEPYGDRSPSYRAIRDPRYRFIHRCLTYTIVGRREGCEKVHQPDLFYLSNIMGKRLVNVPWRLAYWMKTSATGSRESSSLCGGQFVTRLARHFGLETEEELGTCTTVQPSMAWLSMKKLESLDMIESDEGVGGDADSYHWLAVTPVGQMLQPRQVRQAAAGRGAAGRGPGRAGAGRARNVGYAAQFDQISQQISAMTLQHTQRLDQMQLMQRQQFHQTSAHLDYQDGLFEQLFGSAHLQYQPFHYQMPQEYARPPPDQPGPSHQYQQQQDDESDESEYDD